MNSPQLIFPEAWDNFSGGLSASEDFQSLKDRVVAEYQSGLVFPPSELVFTAFRLCLPSEVKVVILGQDPYHGQNEAHGLAFSVRPGVPLPPSLRNIFKEIKEECGSEFSGSGDLSFWASQGVLLLNTFLTVKANEPGSHRFLGWEVFTDELIRILSAKKEGLVFMLWGKHAQGKEQLIDKRKHLILKAPHPSPLSVYRGFFGCGHFVKANEYLQAGGHSPISWSII